MLCGWREGSGRGGRRRRPGRRRRHAHKGPGAFRMAHGPFDELVPGPTDCPTALPRSLFGRLPWRLAVGALHLALASDRVCSIAASRRSVPTPRS